MRWIKKWSFVCILVVLGGVFLAVTDSWYVFARPLERVWEQFMLADKESEAENPGTTEAVIPPATESVSADTGSREEVSMGDGEVSAGDIPETNPAEEEPEVLWRSPEEVVYWQAEDDYFADAVFIGDSRTVGMLEYGGLEEIATFYATTGMTIYKMLDTPVDDIGSENQKQTMEEALMQHQFGKIYLMIGINEMGTGTVDTFIAKYREQIEYLRQLQPNAIIYLQGIMKVTAKRSAQGDYINNEGIEARNEQIAALADNLMVYYLDVNPYVCDESGGMNPAYTFDGVHLKAQYIAIWKDYLKQHAVSLDS